MLTVGVGVAGSGILPVDLCGGLEQKLGLAPAVKVSVEDMRTVGAATRLEIFDSECDDWFETEVSAVCEYGYRSGFFGPAIKVDGVFSVPINAYLKCKVLVNTLARGALWESTDERFKLVVPKVLTGIKDPQIVMWSIQFHSGRDALLTIPIGDYGKQLACLRWTIDWRRVAFGAFVRAIGFRATVAVGAGRRVKAEGSIEEIAKEIGEDVQESAGCWEDFLIDWDP